MKSTKQHQRKLLYYLNNELLPLKWTSSNVIRQQTQIKLNLLTKSSSQHDSRSKCYDVSKYFNLNTHNSFHETVLQIMKIFTIDKNLLLNQLEKTAHYQWFNKKIGHSSLKNQAIYVYNHNKKIYKSFVKSLSDYEQLLIKVTTLSSQRVYQLQIMDIQGTLLMIAHNITQVIKLLKVIKLKCAKIKNIFIFQQFLIKISYIHLDLFILLKQQGFKQIHWILVPNDSEIKSKYFRNQQQKQKKNFEQNFVVQKTQNGSKLLQNNQILIVNENRNKDNKKICSTIIGGYQIYLMENKQFKILSLTKNFYNFEQINEISKIFFHYCSIQQWLMNLMIQSCQLSIKTYYQNQLCCQLTGLYYNQLKQYQIKQFNQKLLYNKHCKIIKKIINHQKQFINKKKNNLSLISDSNQHYLIKTNKYSLICIYCKIHKSKYKCYGCTALLEKNVALCQGCFFIYHDSIAQNTPKIIKKNYLNTRQYIKLSQIKQQSQWIDSKSNYHQINSIQLEENINNQIPETNQKLPLEIQILWQKQRKQADRIVMKIQREKNRQSSSFNQQQQINFIPQNYQTQYIYGNSLWTRFPNYYYQI